MKEDDVFAEYPSDTDDEYVTEKGFQPTLPGESTRLSSALALFRAARILSRVLEKNYPATTSHELSLHQMESLEIELNEWYDGLPAHLRLNFVQDKPSTDVTGSRSPLLVRIALFVPRPYLHLPFHSTDLCRLWRTTSSEPSFIDQQSAQLLVIKLHQPSCPLPTQAST
jgi:hypothetical protein